MEEMKRRCIVEEVEMKLRCRRWGGDGEDMRRSQGGYEEEKGSR